MKGISAQYVAGNSRGHFRSRRDDEKMAEKIWEEGSDEVLVKPLLRPIKIRFFGANRPSNVKRLTSDSPASRGGVFCYFTAYSIRDQTYPLGKNRWHLSGNA